MREYERSLRYATVNMSSKICDRFENSYRINYSRQSVKLIFTSFPTEQKFTSILSYDKVCVYDFNRDLMAQLVLSLTCLSDTTE